MNAKKLIAAAAAVTLIFTSAMAEEEKTDLKPAKKDNPPRVLLDMEEADFSGYGGIYTRYSKIGESNACLVGGRGGFIINDSFVIGIAGMGMTYPLSREKISGKEYTGLLSQTSFGYGGILLEYYFNPKDLIVLSAGTMIGGGGLSFYENIDDEDEDGENHRNGDQFFAVEPEINIFVNITRFCRVGLGVSYRYVAGINSEEFSDKDFRGPAASVMAQFGWF